jgi:hypothetical protein
MEAEARDHAVAHALYSQRRGDDSAWWWIACWSHHRTAGGGAAAAGGLLETGEGISGGDRESWRAGRAVARRAALPHFESEQERMEAAAKKLIRAKQPAPET